MTFYLVLPGQRSLGLTVAGCSQKVQLPHFYTDTKFQAGETAFSASPGIWYGFGVKTQAKLFEGFTVDSSLRSTQQTFQ